jgi:hypothetical protein
MIAVPNQGYFANVLPLIRTLFDIVLLRKGPEDIPRSTVLLLMTLGLWVLAELTSVVLIERVDDSDFLYETFSLLLAIIYYSAIVVIAGYGQRVLQTITTIIGCGALLALSFTAVFVFFGQFVGAAGLELIVYLYLMWSVSVEGHIIARAINRHWYIGILIALAAFALQFFAFILMTSTG